MAETPFEHDLQAMFDEAPRRADDEAFAAAVERRIARQVWLRVGVLTVFGMVGLALSLALAGPSAFDISSLTGGTASYLTGGLAKAMSFDASAWSDTRVWAAGLVLAGLGWLIVRSALTET